jgi:hypothetical protein
MTQLWRCLASLLAAGVLSGQYVAGEADDKEELLTRIRERVRHNLGRLPDYTCQQTVERWMRPTQQREFEKMDTLRLEVGVTGNREIFAWHGSQRFEDRHLAEMVGRGTIGNGDFALHTHNVFLTNTALHTYLGEDILAGRPVYRFEYAVPIEQSRYRLRIPPVEAAVGYSGTYVVDAETLDLLRLEVTADEIPDRLALAESELTLDYARTRIADADFLLPKASRLRMLGTQGEESRNETEFGACRQFAAESAVRYTGTTGEQVDTGPPPTLEIPSRSILEIQLETEVDAESAAVGDVVEGRLIKPVQARDGRLIAAGATVIGRLVRLEKRNLPFDHYEVAFEFQTLEAPEGKANFTATMAQVDKAAGLVQQSKRMDPVFTKRRQTRFDILVRETPKGQGVVQWDAKRSAMKRGLKMKWVVD